MTEVKRAISLAEAIALAEASAFRITPTYLYAFKYKDGNKSLGLVPVHIKHPNVSKHIFDLVDPEPGTPLANTVIGTIPKHYKAATDLILKDHSKKLSDVLTKDGASDDAEPLHQKTITKADVQGALGGMASVPLDAYLHAVNFNQDPGTDLQLLKNPQVTSVLLKVYGANWKEKAAALGFAVPGVNIAHPEVANAAKILKLSPGSEEFKALALLHEFGNMIEAVAEMNGEDASDAVFDKNYLTFETVIALAKKAGLATADEDDDGIITVKFKPMAASPMLVPAPTPPVTSVPSPPADSAAESGFLKKGGKWYVDGYHVADDPTWVGPIEATVNIVVNPKPVVRSAQWLDAAPQGTMLVGSDSYQKKDGNWHINGGDSFTSSAALAGKKLQIIPLQWEPPGFVSLDLMSLSKLPAGKTLENPAGETVTKDAYNNWHNIDHDLIPASSLAGNPFALAAKTPVISTPATIPEGFFLASYDFLENAPDGTIVQDAQGKTLTKDNGSWYKDNGSQENPAWMQGRAFKNISFDAGKAKVIPPGFAVLDLGSLNNGPEGITIQNPEGFTFVKKGGKWWLNGVDLASADALNGQAFKVVAPLQTPTTSTPAATQTASSVAGGLNLPAIPPLATLSFAGDAKAALGGYHPKSFLKDGAGNTFLFKPLSVSAAAASAYANIAVKVFGADNAVPVVAGTVAGVGTGSIQPMIQNKKADLSQVDLTTLTQPQLARLMQERVLDWAIASHDTKAANFLLTTDGNVVGIDKDQSLKFLGKDSLDTTYKPNPTPQIYGALFDLFKKKKIDLPVGAMLPAIEKIEAMSDDGWLANFSSYIDAAASTPAQRTKLKKDILARKKSVRTDLEAFITGVFQARGDIGMTDTFEFESGVVHPKKKKDLSGISTPAMGSILSPAILPALGTLTPGGSADDLKGAGEKFYFIGPDGKYLVKLARSKDKTKIQPKRVAAQEIFSQLSSVIRPGKSVPIADVPGGYKGIPASIQPLLALGQPKDLEGTSPSSLSPSEKKDIAEEHVLDWLTSQHDTHAANLMRRADGTILSVDKEQGFKFFMPNTEWSKTGDQLDVDYHPNKIENPPFYNSFWKAFADGSMDFDPTQMKDVVARIEGIKDSDYIALLSKYVEKAELKDDPQQVAAFIDRALARKKNIRKDFESFIGGLYKKRLKKKKGTFSFAGGWSEGATAAPVAPAAVPAATPADPQKLTFDRNGAQALLPSASDPLAQKVLDAVGKSLFSANSPSPIDPSLWSEVADSNSQAAVTTALASIENITKKSLDAHLKTSAVAAFPNSPLLQQAALQEAFNQKNMLKVNAEAQLTSLMMAKTGKKGKFTFSGGWAVEGALPPPITHTSTESASAIASAAGLEVLPSTDDPTKVVLKIAGQDWKTKQADFEAKAGVTSSGAIKEKPSKSVGVKVFVPYDKATFEKAGITKTWVEQPPAISAKTAPSPKNPAYFPTHAPALPLTTRYADMKEVATTTLGSGGKMYPSDGLAVENNNLSIIRNVDAKTGVIKHVVSFKLRPEVWGSLGKAGAAGQYSWPVGKFDPTQDAVAVTSRSSFSIPTRTVGSGSDVLHYSSGSPSNPNSFDPTTNKLSAADWGNMGFVQAEITLAPGEDITAKLGKLLDTLQPGLSAKVLHEPAPEDAEITKLARVVWSQLPKIALALKPDEFTVKNLKKLIADNNVPTEYLDAQEVELFDGYKSYVVPGRWKSKDMLLPDGSPKVRFMLTSAKTPLNIVKNLSGVGPGPASQTKRLDLGIGLGNGDSMDQDRSSGGSEQSMWRMITESKSAYSLTATMVSGVVTGPYRYLIPPDEMDRLDTIHYNADSFGNMGGSQGHAASQTLKYWTGRKKLEDAVEHEQEHPSGSAEVDFRKGVAGSRVLRVLCANEEQRRAVLDEAKAQGVTHLNGIPVEDFVIATGSRTMEDIYQQFVKPMGY